MWTPYRLLYKAAFSYDPRIGYADTRRVVHEVACSRAYICLVRSTRYKVRRLNIGERSSIPATLLLCPGRL